MSKVIQDARGRWRDEKGRFTPAPVKTFHGWRIKGKFVSVVPYTPPKSTIINIKDFLKEFSLPMREIDTSTEAGRFHQGVLNMGVENKIKMSNRVKLTKMDSDKLLKLYKSQPSLFDWYFAYENEYEFEEYGFEGEYDKSTALIQQYELKYGKLE